MHNNNILKEVLKHYEHLGLPLSIDPITMGLINKTYRVTTTKQQYILQELSSIFETTVIDDSDAVAQHLLAKGLSAPLILRTMSNARFVAVDAQIFRALTLIDGQTTHTVKSLEMAQSAGFILGQFHLALMDLNYDFRSKRRHGGDYQFHKDNLITALNQHAAHDYFKQVEPLANKMLIAIGKVIANLSTTARNVHGDPKISNIIFDENDKAICLIDFDTLGKTGWSLEMADALRSWCNPHHEDVLDAYVDMNIAERALIGYGSFMKGYFTKKEADELIVHTQAISLCLAMRYLADVLNERYWAFDRNRFERAADHNWLRAQAMFNLAHEFIRHQKRLSEMIDVHLINAPFYKEQ